MNLSIGKLFALLVFTPLILGVSVLVEHGAAECFYEMLKIGEKLSISFDVDMEGGYDITFYITDPKGVRIVYDQAKTHGLHHVRAEEAGKYTYCFTKEPTTRDVLHRVVAFAIHDGKDDAKPNPDLDAKEATLKQDDSLASLDGKISHFGEIIDEMRDHQQYIIRRDYRHRQTVESTCDRVKWWNLFQVGIIAFFAIFQLSYLKRLFEVKRII